MPVAPPVDANPAVLSPDDGPGPARSVDAMITTDACVDVAAHIAEVVIASITDETVKAQQEQDKTRLVRKVAETCTTDKWSDGARKCFLDGKTGPELEKCGRALAAPKPD